MDKRFALVTGASKGLGRSISFELASRGKDLLLVSLDHEGLHELSKKISEKYNIDINILEIDFFKKESVYFCAEWANRFDIDILINNVGLGVDGKFEEVSIEKIDLMIQINVWTTTMLTKLLIQNLKKQPRSYILNVSSMVSFSPTGYKTIYPATKAFIYMFSLGLQEELRNSNIFVSSLHPGPMRTNNEVITRINRLGIFGSIGLLSPAKVAEAAISKLYKNSVIIIPGFFNKINWILIKLTPNWFRIPIITRIFKRQFNR